MSRKYILLCIYPLLMSAAFAKGIVDCRVATGIISTCNPYASKFLVAKEIEYQKDKKELIVSKTLPVPEKSVKVISVIDMIEKHVKIEKPIRYEGSEERQPEALNIESEQDNNRHSLSRELELRREATMAKLLKMEEEAYSKMQKIDVSAILVPKREENLSRSELTKAQEAEVKGFYTIEKGDTLSTIAKKFCLKTAELRTHNKMQKGDRLKVGKRLAIPLEQDMIDTIAKAEYVIKPGDNIGTIARDFNLSSDDICKYNNVKNKSLIRVGEKLTLPFPHKLAELEKEYKARQKAEAKNAKLLKGIGKRKLRVTATAYSSHKSQTDKTPFLAAWNNRIRPGMKIIAVSRDMLTKYGLRNGSKVRIGGLSGYYTVRDKMHKRYKKRIDIYMGMNRRKALRWGRRSVMLYY